MQKKHKMMSQYTSSSYSKVKLCAYIDDECHDIMSTVSIFATTTMPIIANAESSISAPIGEMVDGSTTSASSSFGQWFFLLYVVVSLLAGGKEMIKRVQKQMDKDSD